jgi:hypothetical protein
MDRVELAQKSFVERQRVAMDELKRIARLRLDIDAHDLETGPVIAHPSASGATAQIEQAGPHPRNTGTPNIAA